MENKKVKKITVDKKFIKNLIDAYDKLGFIFENYDVNDCNVEYENIRVSFMRENGRCSNKFIKNVTLKDLDSAYAYSSKDAKTEKEMKSFDKALINLKIAYKYDDTKKKIHQLMFHYIISEKQLEDDAKNKVERLQMEAEMARQEDINKMIDDDKKQNNKAQKVVAVEENEEVAKKAKNSISKDSILITAGLIILASAIGFGSMNMVKAARYKAYMESIEQEEINNGYKDEPEDNKNTIVINDEPEAPVEQPAEEPVAEEAPVEEVVEEPQVDVHSEEFIQNVTDNIVTNIEMLGDKTISAKYDRELVEYLVRYTHHDYDEYTGPNKLSNEAAYEDLSELIRHGFDVSMFYEGLNNYENIRALNRAAADIKQEKGQYEDEFKVYMCMDVIMNEMNTNNFPEAVVLRAFVDNTSVIPSMQMARQQAGVLEMKDTPELWADVNKDGKKTYEENAEGKGYNEEKARAMAAKYGEMSSEKCAQIYNRISTDNQNSELTQIVYRALDEDNAKVKIR